MDSSEVPANVKEKIYDDLIAPAAKQIGSGIGYVGGFVSTLLCRPLHHVDLHMKAYWDKADAEFSSKRAEIPKEQLIEPSLQLVHNAVQSLSATVTIDELRSLFINLLASACDKRVANGVLPSFPSILQDLTPDEARLLYLFATSDANPFVEKVMLDFSEGTPIPGTTKTNLFVSTFSERAKCAHPENIPAYLDNLARLRLIEIPLGLSYSDKSLYDEIMSLEETKEWTSKKHENPNIKYDLEFKFVSLTSFGAKFCSLCGLTSGADRELFGPDF